MLMYYRLLVIATPIARRLRGRGHRRKGISKNKAFFESYTAFLVIKIRSKKGLKVNSIWIIVKQTTDEKKKSENN